MTKFLKSLALLQLGFALATVDARAGTFTYNGFSVDPANVSVTITSPVSRTVLAGEITLDGTGPNANQLLAAWCLDLIDTLNTGPYTYQESQLTPGGSFANVPALNATQIQQIGDLMESGGLSGDRAATQLAIWKIEFGNALSFLTAGLPGNLIPDVNADLNAVLPGGSLFDQNVTVTVLHDAVTAPNQTLGFAVPVPGPTVGAGFPGMALAGLGMLWFARRRKNGAA